MSLLLALTGGGGGGGTTNYADSLSAGAYLIAGHNVTDAVARADDLSPGAYLIAGHNVTDAVARADDLSPGAYLIAGHNVTDVVSSGALLWGPTGVEYLYLASPYSLNMCTMQLVLPVTNEIILELC
jgi:hypothetical protein